LSDPERVVQRDLDIQEYTDPTNDPMIPHTLVLEPELKIYKSTAATGTGGRPSIYELWLDQREVTRRIRPDWDISSSEMRSAWERGERDRFFPYGKRFRDVWATT
jgi:hypothetical protein